MLLTLAVTAFAQPQPPAKARIEGSVVSSTGEPIPRVTVRLTGQATVAPGAAAAPFNVTATTDDAGKFVIENIDPGRNYNLQAQRQGYVNTRWGARSATVTGAPLRLDPGADVKGLVITMTQQGVISGKVTDQAGDPVQNALIYLMRRGYQRGVRELVPSSTASTNDQGEFRMANLAPGRYYAMVTDRLALVAGVGGTTAGGGRPGNIATYYPSATDVQTALPIDVTSGSEQRGIDLRFQQAKMFAIRGKVEGVPSGVANINLQALPKGMPTGIDLLTSIVSRGSASRPPEYAFELPNLTPGSYMISPRAQIVANGTNSVRTGSPVEVLVTDGDLSGLVIPFTTSAPIKGTVTLEGGDVKILATQGAPPAELLAAAAAAGVVLNVAGPRPTIGLMPASGLPPIAATARISETGTFTIEGAAPGKYQLNFGSLPPGVYVKSARFGGEDALGAGIDLTSGAGGELTIVLSNKSAELTGVVRDDKQTSLAGLPITLWSKEPEPGNANNGVRPGTADQNGAFQFQNLPPGEYFAAAWEDIDLGLVQSRDFLAQFTADATPVTLTESGRGAIEVKLIPLNKIKAAEEKLP